MTPMTAPLTACFDNRFSVTPGGLGAAGAAALAAEAATVRALARAAYRLTQAPRPALTRAAAHRPPHPPGGKALNSSRRLGAFTATNRRAKTAALTAARASPRNLGAKIAGRCGPRARRSSAWHALCMRCMGCTRPGNRRPRTAQPPKSPCFARCSARGTSPPRRPRRPRPAKGEKRRLRAPQHRPAAAPPEPQPLRLQPVGIVARRRLAHPGMRLRTSRGSPAPRPAAEPAAGAHQRPDVAVGRRPAL